MSVVILFFTYACIRSGNARKAVFSYRSLPHWGRGTAQRRSGALVNDALETISPDLFHTASPIQPPPLRGTSFHRKEGASTRAPSLGRGCRAQRGGVGFLFGQRSRLLFAFPIGERGPRSGARVLIYRLLEAISPLSFMPLVPYPPLRGTFPSRGKLCIGDSGTLANGALETISPDLFHTASTLSGSLRSPPSPRGEGFVSGTAALSQMPRLHSAQTKTALRRLALQSGFWFYYSTVTDFARFLGLSTSFPLLIEV